MDNTILDREIFWMKHQIRSIERNPERNFRIKNHFYIPSCFDGEPAVGLDQENCLYEHLQEQLNFLENARQGHIMIKKFPLMAPEYLKKAIFSH